MGFEAPKVRFLVIVHEMFMGKTWISWDIIWILYGFVRFNGIIMGFS